MHNCDNKSESVTSILCKSSFLILEKSISSRVCSPRCSRKVAGLRTAIDFDKTEDRYGPCRNHVQRFEALVEEGSKLTPLGGFDFSGYNARLQDNYLAWRKACLTSLELVGPIGVPYKNKIAADASGGLFYQSSANLIFTSMRELFEKLKVSPELASEPGPAPAAAAAPEIQPQSSGGPRTLKPPQKPAAPQAAAPQSAPAQAPAGPKKAYVIGEINDSLRQQLAVFLEEVGVEEIPIDRIRGEMIALESITDSQDAQVRILRPQF